VVVGVSTGTAAAGTDAHAADTPWWPSRYGADDEAGALNEIDAAAVLRGLATVRAGRVHDLGHVLDARSPAFPGRVFTQQLTTAAHAVNRRRPDGGPDGLGANGVGWIVEHVQATSQMGTHVDGLNHLQIGDRTYNGHRLADIVEEHGTNRLGIDTLPQVVTRGLLLDVAALRGVDRLGPGDVVTPDDADAALARIGTTVQPGDAVLFHTGWGRLWDDDPATYPTGEPGPGMALASWLVERRVALTGCDTWSYGPVPPEDPARPFEVPQTLNVHHGVVVAENLRLRDVAAAGVGEFLFVLAHPKLRGATGAWVAPLAVV
jgi:kynurenine formamidase